MTPNIITSGATLAVLLLSGMVHAAPPAGALVNTLNQLETARLPQPTQRLEFPLVGEESAFKFNFAKDVRNS